MFRAEPTISEVLEEVYHFKQERKGLNQDQPDSVRNIINEIDAKKYLLSIADKYKIPSEEIAESREHLNYYERLLDEMER